MAKNRIAYYTQEGRLQSCNFNFDNFSTTTPPNTVTNLFSGTIASVGPEGGKLLNMKLNTPSSIFKSGSIGLNNNIYLILKYVSATEEINLRTIRFDHTDIDTKLASIISDWENLLLTLEDPKGNKYINMPANSSIRLEVKATGTDSASFFKYGNISDAHPLAIKIISYIEDY